MNFERDCDNLMLEIKSASWFPYKEGNLRSNATHGQMISGDTYHISFDGTVAPYVQYLEEGTKPHDIPFAFIGKGNWKWWYPFGDGIPFLFGMGGRFDGKFHPGSTKHKGFISDKTINAILNYFVKKYGGTVE